MSATFPRAVLLPSLLALLVGGCMAGPDYHGPQSAVSKAPAANGPFVSGADPAFAQAPLPDHWWTLYEDKRLDGYVEEALAANADLRAADANLRRANEVVHQVEAGRTVQTSLGAGTFAARVGGYTLTKPLDLPYSYILDASVAYPLDLAGGIKRGIEASRDNAEAVQAARDQVRVTIAAAVARSYADICSANLSLAATRHVLDIQNNTLASMQRLFKGGRGTSFDITRARTAADRSSAAIPEIIATREGALFQLAALMGRAPADYPREMEACNAPPELHQPIPIGDGSALIRRRPDIRASERQLAAATAGHRRGGGAALSAGDAYRIDGVRQRDFGVHQSGQLRRSCRADGVVDLPQSQTPARPDRGGRRRCGSCLGAVRRDHDRGTPPDRNRVDRLWSRDRS
jgi:outer membrane protein TolC